MLHKRTKVTPPQLAARYGVSTDKVLSWIRSGELRAFNSATTRSGRPRWLIDESDIADFEAGRAAHPKPQPRTRRKARQAGDVIPFFQADGFHAELLDEAVGT